MKRRYGRLAGRDAARTAIPAYVCTNLKCELSNPPRKLYGKWPPPDRCMGCGGMSFDRFPSTGEASRWLELRMLEKRGVIRNLRRQVSFDLKCPAPNGLIAKVAAYIADFTYERIDTGASVIEDHKPASGVDPVADLKLRWMAAQGNPVNIHT